MLNKEVWMNCYERHFDPARQGLVEAARVNWDRWWDDGRFVVCPDALIPPLLISVNERLHSILREPPSWCPYVTEHTVCEEGAPALSKRVPLWFAFVVVAFGETIVKRRFPVISCLLWIVISLNFPAMWREIREV